MTDYTISIEITGDNKLSGTLKVSSQDLQRFNNDAKQASSGVTSFESAQRQLNRTLQAFGIGVSVAAAKQLAEQMYDLGSQVQAADRVFQHFGGNETVLQGLRDATRGLTDDLTLMNGAAQFLNLGITQTQDETTRLIGMIAAVKKPTDDMTSAFSNFASLMSNQSYLRLDSFGISSARVRDRVEELKASLNMGSEAAFTQATMEALTDKVNELGDAAFASDTAVHRLQVQLQNAAQQGAEQFASVIDRAVTSLEQLAYIVNTGNFGALFGAPTVSPFDLRQSQTLERLTELYQRQLVQLATTAQTSAASSASEALAQLEREITSAQSTNEGFSFLPTEGEVRDLTDAEKSFLQEWASGVTKVQFAWQSASRSVIDYLRNANAARLETERAAAAEEDRRQSIRDQWDAFQQQFGVDPATVLGDRRGVIDMQAMQRMMRGSIGGQLLYAPREAARAQEIAATYENFVSILDQSKSYIESGWITQEAVDNVKAIADDAQKFADEAERGAKAFLDMSLSDIFGTSSGGLLGSIGDELVRAAQARGMSQDEIDQLKQSFDRASFRSTNLSEAFQDQLLPDILNLPEGQRLQAVQNFIAAMQMARLLGIPQGDLAKAGIGSFAGIFGTNNQQMVDVVPGDNLYTLAGRYGGSWQDYKALLDQNGYLQVGQQPFGAGGSFYPTFNPIDYVSQFASRSGYDADAIANAVSIMADDAPVAAQSFSDITQQVYDTRTGMSDIKDWLAEISKSAHKVTIDLEVKAPLLLQWIFDMTFSGDTPITASKVRANGGVVPGSDPRGRQIERN